MDLIFLDNYEENDIWHDKFKKYFFFELCRLFCDLHGPSTTTSHRFKKKISCENWHHREQYKPESYLWDNISIYCCKMGHPNARFTTEYPLKLCLIQCESDIDVYNFKKWLFSDVVTHKVTNVVSHKVTIAHLYHGKS